MLAGTPTLGPTPNIRRLITVRPTTLAKSVGATFSVGFSITTRSALNEGYPCDLLQQKLLPSSFTTAQPLPPASTLRLQLPGHPGVRLYVTILA